MTYYQGYNGYGGQMGYPGEYSYDPRRDGWGARPQGGINYPPKRKNPNPRPGVSHNHPSWRTVPCKFWDGSLGSCAKGDACSYMHDTSAQYPSQEQDAVLREAKRPRYTTAGPDVDRILDTPLSAKRPTSSASDQKQSDRSSENHRSTTRIDNNSDRGEIPNTINEQSQNIGINDEEMKDAGATMAAGNNREAISNPLSTPPTNSTSASNTNTNTIPPRGIASEIMINTSNGTECTSTNTIVNDLLAQKIKTEPSEEPQQHPQQPQYNNQDDGPRHDEAKQPASAELEDQIRRLRLENLQQQKRCGLLERTLAELRKTLKALHGTKSGLERMVGLLQQEKEALIKEHGAAETQARERSERQREECERLVKERDEMDAKLRERERMETALLAQNKQVHTRLKETGDVLENMVRENAALDAENNKLKGLLAGMEKEALEKEKVAKEKEKKAWEDGKRWGLKERDAVLKERNRESSSAAPQEGAAERGRHSGDDPVKNRLEELETRLKRLERMQHLDSQSGEYARPSGTSSINTAYPVQHRSSNDKYREDKVRRPPIKEEKTSPRREHRASPTPHSRAYHHYTDKEYTRNGSVRGTDSAYRRHEEEDGLFTFLS